jgi:hypothetical protein
MAISLGGFSGGGGGGAVDSVNGQTGVVVVSGDDIAADHTASNYTAANANIDGHLSGIDTKLGTLIAGLTYQGSYDATNNLPSLANTLKGDFYLVSTGGTRFGRDWAVGDHLVINEDMGGTVSNGKIDKIDNTDQVTSVNTQTGAVVLSGNDLAADHSASNYTAANANIDGHLSGIDTELGTLLSDITAERIGFLSDVTIAGAANGDLLSYSAGEWVNNTSTSDFLASTAGLDDLSDVSYTPGAGIDNYVLTYDHSTTSWGAEAAASGGLSEIVQDTSPQLGGDLDVNGNSITSAGNANVLINPAGTGDISIGADLIPDADATHTIGDEDNRYISTYSDLNGAIRFKAKNAQGAQITKGQAVYISGVSGTVPEVQLARANSASTMPAFGLVYATANTGADVEIVTFGNLTDYDTTTYSLSANDTVFISAATAGALTNTAPTGETNLIQNIGRVVRADASAGIIKAGGAGRSNATPNLDSGKVFLGNGSNQAVSTALSAINLSSFNNDSGFITSVASASETVEGIIEIATNAEAAAATATDKALVPSNIASLDLSNMDNTTSGFITDVVSDTTPQLGGPLDVNGQDIVSVSNGDIEVDPNGTGSFKIKGNATSGSGRLVLNCEQNTHGITLKGPPHSAAASYTLTFPNTDGTADQVLKTDGSGALDWVDQTSGGGGWTYSVITADPANAQASYHYSCTGTFTITLATSGMNAGEEIRVKNMGTGTITIDPQTSTIDGSTTDYGMDVQYSAITLVSTGTNWEII